MQRKFVLTALAPLNRLCPLLNGTMKQDDVGKNKAFMGMAPPPLG